MPVVVFMLFTGLVVVLICVSYVMNKKRRQELMAWGEQRGLRFSADDPFDIPERLSAFGLMKQGHSHKAMNVLWADGDGRDLRIFQYQYTTGSGKEETTYTCCAGAWQLPVDLQELVIRPEGFFDHVAAWFGHDRIEFESTEFNQRFHVAGTDKRQIYAVITPQMMEFLLASKMENLEVRGQTALVYQNEALVPERGAWLLAVAEGFTKNIPGHVVGNKEG